MTIKDERPEAAASVSRSVRSWSHAKWGNSFIENGLEERGKSFSGTLKALENGFLATFLPKKLNFFLPELARGVLLVPVKP